MARARSSFQWESSWLDGLPGRLSEGFAEIASTRTFGRGGAVYSFGDPPDGLWAVLDGCLRYEIAPDGNLPMTFDFVRPGMLFGQRELFDLGPRRATVTATETSRLSFVPLTGLQRLGAEEPAIWRALGALNNRHLERVEAAFQALTERSASQRIVGTLLRITEPYDKAPGQPVEIEISQETLAGLTACSRATVISALKRLEKCRLIRCAYRRLIVVDREGLKHLGRPKAA